jgi:hypothetical protein
MDLFSSHGPQRKDGPQWTAVARTNGLTGVGRHDGYGSPAVAGEGEGEPAVLNGGERRQQSGCLGWTTKGTGGGNLSLSMA